MCRTATLFLVVAAMVSLIIVPVVGGVSPRHMLSGDRIGYENGRYHYSSVALGNQKVSDNAYLRRSRSRRTLDEEIRDLREEIERRDDWSSYIRSGSPTHPLSEIYSIQSKLTRSQLRKWRRNYAQAYKDAEHWLNPELGGE